MNLRWYLFWIADFIKGRKIRKSYNDIKRCYYAGNDKTEEKIYKLLKHAQNTTQYYKNCNIDDITEFPVVNKRKIIENYDDILSDVYKGKKLHKMSTSGSTGTPFTVVQNPEKRKRVIAEVLFFGKVCGYTFGEKQIFLRVWVDSVKKSWLKRFLQNMITEDISALDKNKMEELENILVNDKKISNILSYASTLDNLSKFLIEKNHKPVDFSVKSIVSGSELLQDETRNNLKKVFGCTVVSRYANEENGIMGQECEKQEFHLNTADYYFEFLKVDEDKPAKEGELARIVVTDLYNYALPMIRYDTGDLAIIGKSSCNIKSNVIKEIFGRRVDLIYDTKGNALSPHTITNNMWEVKNIKQFKFTQISKSDYRILLNLSSAINVKQENMLKKKLLDILGEDANIIIEYTNEIPVMSSGKRKYIENLYK